MLLDYAGLRSRAIQLKVGFNAVYHIIVRCGACLLTKEEPFGFFGYGSQGFARGEALVKSMTMEFTPH